jgi:hypothetical protein
LPAALEHGQATLVLLDVDLSLRQSVGEDALCPWEPEARRSPMEPP